MTDTARVDGYSVGQFEFSTVGSFSRFVDLKDNHPLRKGYGYCGRNGNGPLRWSGDLRLDCMGLLCSICGDYNHLGIYRG